MMQRMGDSMGEIEKVTGRWENQNRWESLKEKKFKRKTERY